MNDIVLRQLLLVTGSFVALELLVVGVFGAWAARRLQFSPNRLIPLAFAVYAAAGFTMAPLGGSAFLAGGIVAAVDAVVWACTSAGYAKEMPNRRWLLLTATIPGAFGFVIGGVCGWIGGWLSAVLS